MADGGLNWDELARQIAPSVTVNGWTPETVLARDAGREASDD